LASEGYKKRVEVVIIYWGRSTEGEGNMARVFAIIMSGEDEQTLQGQTEAITQSKQQLEGGQDSNLG
jgi:hypothetical protein